MRYLLLIYQELPTSPPTESDMGAVLGEYKAYGQWLRETGQYVGGEALHPVSAATTVSVQDGKRLVTDGPFAETKEHLGGYYLVDAADLDAAIEAAARIPGASSGRVEVRPIFEFG